MQALAQPETQLTLYRWQASKFTYFWTSNNFTTRFNFVLVNDQLL